MPHGLPGRHPTAFALVTWLVLLLGAGPSTGDPAPPPPPHTDRALAARAALVIARLQSSDFRAREAAVADAADLPPETLPLIEGALASDAVSPEVAPRLELIVAVLRRKAVATAYERGIIAEMDWLRGAVTAAYDRAGHGRSGGRVPPWDAAAREALAVHIRPRFDPNVTARDRARVAAAFERAIALGCDDPIVLHFYAQAYRLTATADPRRAADLVHRAAAGLLGGDYPASLRLGAALRRAEAVAIADGSPPSPAVAREVRRDLDTADRLFAAAATEGAPDAVLIDFANLMLDLRGRLDNDGQRAFEGVAGLLRAARPAGHLADAFAADYYLRRAARVAAGQPNPPGASLTPAQRAQLRADALERAGAALSRALPPATQDAYVLNLKLALLRETGCPRAEFDAWFDRAMAAYPNNLAACRTKREFLDRHAHPDAALEFAQQCAADGNWASRIPFVLVDAHLRRAAREPDPDAYLASDVVWDQLATVYENYLRRYPAAQYDRSWYANLACRAGRWKVASTQFGMLGDAADQSVFGGAQNLGYLRKKAARLAGEAGPE